MAFWDFEDDRKLKLPMRGGGLPLKTMPNLATPSPPPPTDLSWLKDEGAKTETQAPLALARAVRPTATRPQATTARVPEKDREVGSKSLFSLALPYIPAIVGALSGGDSGDEGPSPAETQAAATSKYQMELLQEYGEPALDAMMTELGFRWDAQTGGWVMDGTGEQIDAREMNEMMAETRSWMEPELQRMLKEMGGALEERGMGRSSISTGMRGELRSRYWNQLVRARYQIKQQLQARRWQRLLGLLAGSQGQAAGVGGVASTQLGLAEQARLREAQSYQEEMQWLNMLGTWGAGQGQASVPGSDITYNYYGGGGGGGGSSEEVPGLNQEWWWSG